MKINKYEKRMCVSLSLNASSLFKAGVLYRMGTLT